MKKIIALFTVICILMFSVPVFADDLFEAADNGIKDTDGTVEIRGKFNLAENLPITIIAASQIIENSKDVTAQKIKDAVSAEQFLSFVEYADTMLVPPDGMVDLRFNAKESLKSGYVNIYVVYNGGNDFVKIGGFEHVSKGDVKSIVNKFNEQEYDTYPEVISEDFLSDNILQKIGANITGYNNLAVKTDFSQILASFMPDGGFEGVSLVQKFNEAVAWAELREQDTLTILKKYNGEYWKLELADADDYFKLSDTEKSKVLNEIKNKKLYEKTRLNEVWTSNIALAKFREVTDRESLADLTDSGKYAEFFTLSADILKKASLDDYYKIYAYNHILANNSSCMDFDEVLKLYEAAVKAAKDKKKDDSSSADGKSGSRKSGGGGISARTAVDKKANNDIVSYRPHPFSDVPENHWADGYIAKLYKDGAVSGISYNQFAPEAKILRQDFVKIIVSALGLEPLYEESGYDDVVSGSYYEPYIVTAVKAGLINGVDERNFGLTNIKREDAAVVISRALKLAEITGAGVVFKDAEAFSDYAVEAIEKLSSLGLFVGDENGCFNSQAPLTRAESCAIIVRLGELLSKEEAAD